MIDFIVKVWYNDAIISKEMIYKSFRAIGIANKLDHSENSLFQACSKIKEEKLLIEDELGDSYENANLDEIPDEDED